MAVSEPHYQDHKLHLYNMNQSSIRSTRSLGSKHETFVTVSSYHFHALECCADTTVV